MNTAQETDENRKPLDEQGEQYSPLDDPDVLPIILRFFMMIIKHTTNTAQETDENRKPLDEQGEQYSPLDDPDVLPIILRFMDRESIRSMQQTQKQWGGVTQPSGILPPCVDERVWENRTEQPCTFGRRWDFDPETIMRATLCAFDTVRNQPFQHITHPLMHPIHMYVRSGRGIDTFKDNEVVKCMLQHGYRIGVTLLYPPGVNIDNPLPRVAGLTPERSLVVVDVPIDGLPKEALVQAQTIRFEGERTHIYGQEFELMLNLEELPPHMPHLNTIGSWAFRNCTSLRELGRMDSLVRIERWAFETCTGLTELGQMNALHTIGQGAFCECLALTGLGRMDALHTIEQWAFRECTGLTELGQMNALHTIGQGAFLDCQNLTELGDMNALRVIEADAFFGCTRLTKFHIPSNIQRVGPRAFGGNCPLSELTVDPVRFQFTCEDQTLRFRLLQLVPTKVTELSISGTTVTVNGTVAVS